MVNISDLTFSIKMSYTYKVKITGTVACSVCKITKPFDFIIDDKEYNKGGDFDENVQTKVRAVTDYFTCDNCCETCCKNCITHDDKYEYMCKKCNNEKDNVKELEDAYE